MLRTTTYRLRKALYEECILRDHSYYRLDPGGEFWLDASEFERLVQHVQSGEPSDGERQVRLEEAVKLYRGPFLTGHEGEWLENTRRKLESYYLTAVMSLAEELHARGQYAEVARTAQLALEADPYHEDALAFQMERWYSQANAWRHWSRTAVSLTVMRGEMGEDPSPRLQRLAKRTRSLLTPPSMHGPASPAGPCCFRCAILPSSVLPPIFEILAATEIHRILSRFCDAPSRMLAVTVRVAW